MMQKEEELLEHYQKLERDLRNELNLAKIEFTTQYEEKSRRLAEERASMQKEYEHRLRELEARYRGKDS